MSDDLIRRSDAIKALKSILSDDINTSILFFWQNQTVGRGIDKIKNLPSADRPQGEWYQIKDHKVMGEGYLWHCSLCGHRVYQDSSADYPTENYCPNCGCRMKGADDEIG